MSEDDQDESPMRKRQSGCHEASDILIMIPDSIPLIIPGTPDCAVLGQHSVGSAEMREGPGISNEMPRQTTHKPEFVGAMF